MWAEQRYLWRSPVLICVCTVDKREGGLSIMPLMHFPAIFGWPLMWFLYFMSDLYESADSNFTVEFLVYQGQAAGYKPVLWRECLEDNEGRPLSKMRKLQNGYLYCNFHQSCYISVTSYDTCSYCGLQGCQKLHVTLLMLQVLPNINAWICLRDDLYVTRPQYTKRGRIYFAVNVTLRSIHYWKRHWLKCRQMYITHTDAPHFKYLIPFLAGRYEKRPASLKALCSKTLLLERNVQALSRQNPKVRELYDLVDISSFIGKLPYFS